MVSTNMFRGDLSRRSEPDSESRVRRGRSAACGNGSSSNLRGSVARLRRASLLVLGLLFAVFAMNAAAQDGGNRKSRRIGQFVTVRSPITDSQVAHVGNIAVELQTRAEREDADVILIIEV